MTEDKGTSFERTETVDLLIVMAEGGTCVVEAPMCMAVVGSFVAFVIGEWTHHGEVVELNCKKCGRIYPIVQVKHPAHVSMIREERA